MKKERVVKIQKILGIILLVVGIILFCGSVYMIHTIESPYVISLPSEYNQSGDYVNYIDQQVNSGQISREMGAMQIVAIAEFNYNSFYFKTSLFSQILIFSLLLVILGIMNLFQAAYNNNKIDKIKKK